MITYKIRNCVHSVATGSSFCGSKAAETWGWPLIST